MSRKNIGRFSFGFQLLLWTGGIYHRLYYRRFTIIGRDKVPEGKPVIFAANHQNALMDALAIIFATRRQVVFMARADIFRKKIIAALLYFLKILPVYRIRDGFHSVDQNKEVFREVFRVMKANRPVALFPEGNHYGEKRLRALKKGAARIALLAEEANNFSLGVSIVPVGIDYSNYYHAGSDLLVQFGEPIPASRYREEYLENPACALSRMTDDLSEGLRKVMLDIGPEEDYLVIHEAVKLYAPVELEKNGVKKTQLNLFLAKNRLSERLSEKKGLETLGLETLRNEMASYFIKLSEFGIRDNQLTMSNGHRAESIVNSVISIVLIPIQLYGMVLNYLPYGLPIFLARKIKDRHFLSSVRFGVGLLLFYAWYLILVIVSFLIFDNIFLAVAFLLSVPISGIFTFYSYRNLLRLRGNWRWIMLKHRNRKEFDGLIEQRKRIMNEIIRLLNKTEHSVSTP